MSKQPDAPVRVTSLLRRQHGRCAYCKLYFKAEDVLEVDHIIPRSQGGKDVNTNCQLLHRHCHDSKTVKDGSLKKGGADDNSQAIEEPDEVKASSPVLQPSGVGDRLA
jgi:RNA-directed DNA polymerase